MKRLFDIEISLLLMVLLSPLYLINSVIVLCDLGWPIIYKHRYPGLNEQLFTMYRFRTMTNETDERGHLLKPTQRLTRIGAFLKKYSLDDLPELFNVLKGDMSLVGPRPVLIRAIPSKNQIRIKRHAVRPGMTGWSQIHGHKQLTWEEKFKLDLYYIEHQSLAFDLKIIGITILQLFGVHRI